MEGTKPKQNSLEHKTGGHKEFMKRFFNRHLAIVLYALLAGVSQKELQAQKVGKEVETVAVEASQDSVELERKNAFKKLKGIVEKEKITEKVKKQQEIFGPAVDGFLSIHWINNDLKFLARLEEAEKRAEENIFVNKNVPIAMTTGSIVADAYKKRWEHNKLVNKPLSFKNIDAVPGLSLRDFQAFLDNTYPKNYVTASISEIEFVGQTDIRNEGKTEMLGQVEPFGINMLLNSKLGDLRGVPLKINLPTTGIDKESFIDVFQHEVGHPNDWNNSRVLTSAERVSMLDEVYSRSISKDRYISEYVEGITLDQLYSIFKLKVEDNKVRRQYLAYVRVSEYWAEIQKAYFKNQNKFKKENPADYAVVKKWITIISK
ncbi:MAG TPA: hypothetical protein VK675_03310 [Candidatus Paceibacterota bacterium]|nr:hypothetical protein [Candidatus Paceibacterota bacterium]